MGLSIRQALSAKRGMLVLMIAFGLIAQPVYGILAGNTASAAPFGDVVVRAADLQGWLSGNSSGGGNIFVDDTTAPYGNGALELTTNETNPSRAQRAMAVSADLASISALSYSTRYVSGPAHAGAALQITINNLSGVASNRSTTLVYEPYWNGTVDTSGAWQNWDTLVGGKFWSTATIAGTSFVNGSGGAPFYTIADVIAAHPNAKITSVKLNIGTYNPSWVVRADGVNLSGTVYDFEPVAIIPPAVPGGLDYAAADQSCDSFTKTNYSQPTWDAVLGATSYGYRALFDNEVIYQTVLASNQHPGGPFGSAQNGVWGFQVQSIAANGASSDWSPVCKITLDTGDPTINYITPSSENQLLRPSDTLVVEFADAIELGRVTVHGYKDGQTPVPSLWVHPYVDGTAKTISLPLGELTDGSYQIRAAATDEAGNRAQVNRTLRIDGTGPTVTVQPSSVGSAGVYSKIGFNFFDANKVDRIMINGEVKDLSDNEYSNLDDIGSPYWYGAQEGLNTLVVYDVLGNSTLVNFTIDRTAPVVEITGTTRNSDGSYTINGTTTDSDASIMVALGGINYSATPVEGIWSFTTVVLSTGSHTVSAKSVDEVGNTSATSQTIIVVPTFVGPELVVPETTTPPLSTVPLIEPVAVAGGVAASTASSTQAVTGQTGTTATGAFSEEGEVLGTETTATPLEKTATLATSQQGWKLWGVAWYWYLLAAAAIGAIWWFMAALRRRRKAEEF